MNQMSIDFTTAARATDPWTSHAAAAKASESANGGRLLVLHELALRPLNDFELADATHWQQTSIGKRRLECARMGWVVPHCDAYGVQISRKAPSGSPSLVWAITNAGLELVREMSRGAAMAA